MQILNSIVSGLSAVSLTIASVFGLAPESDVQNLERQLELRDEAIEQFISQAEESQVLGAYNISGGGTYRLKSSIGTTDSSIQLSSFKEPVSNILYTMSYLDTTVAYGTVDPQTTRTEFISFTGITQNSDGSATLTGVTRGLTRTPAGELCTASTTLAQRHPGQSIFILSDSPCHFAEYAVKRNDETVTGQWGFPYPSASSSVATKGYVDSVALGTATVDKLIVSAVAGETVSAGQILYFNTLEAEWRKADANAVASTTNVILGVAQGAGTDGVSISGGVLLHGLDTNNIGGVAGNTIYISDTAGATSTTAGTYSKKIGVIRTSASFYFDPFMGEVSVNANNAFVGTNTFTGATNLASTTFTATTTFNIVPYVVTYDATSTINNAVYTWTKNPGLRYAKVELWGGGGGGGTTADAGGGGGGGAYNTKTFYAAELGATETITVGKGGATTTNGVGGTGGTSSFGSHISAYGGAGGNNAGSGQGGGGGGIAGAGSGRIGGAPLMLFGGLGTNASTTQVFGGGYGGGGAQGFGSIYGGGGGDDAPQTTHTQYSSIYGGAGGGGASGDAGPVGAGGLSLFGGAGGASGDASPAPQAGTAPGGGGGASGDVGVASGAGAVGRVKITEYYY